MRFQHVGTLLASVVVTLTFDFGLASAEMNDNAMESRSSGCPASKSQGTTSGSTESSPWAGMKSSTTSKSAFNVGGCGAPPVVGPYGIACRLGGESVMLTPPAGSIARVVFVWYGSNGDFVDYAEAFTPQSDGSYRVTTSTAPGIVSLQAQIIFSDNSSATDSTSCQ